MFVIQNPAVMKRHFILYLIILAFLAVSCKKSKEYIHTTFTVNGVEKKYENSDYFSKSLCGSSTWCGHFHQEPMVTIKNYMKFGIPGDPVIGRVYWNYEQGCKVVYRNENETEYTLGNQMSFSFSRWDGPGGWAEGTFNGWLKSLAGDSIQITNGYFQNMISSGK